MPPLSQPKRSWLLLIISFLWAFLTGVFLTLPSLQGIQWIAFVVAIVFSAAVSYLGRKGLWLGIGFTLVVCYRIAGLGEPAIVIYMVGMTIGLNFVLFSATAKQLRQRHSSAKTFFQLTITSLSALGLGWLAGALGG
ncbi:hypothetical protein ACN4EK_09040 [Pantanalinema rosaneae CENA516]|uniref:hypothetical protein n=1 Tax=Pantanalinema rosaneae TaxID=1620701 RepID=UPI003D6E80BE